MKYKYNMVAHKKDKNKITKHHIIPKSRGGNKDLENIVGLPANLHQAYHTIFSNRTPDEIVEHLAEFYWNGGWEYVKQAYEAHLNYLETIKEPRNRP